MTVMTLRRVLLTLFAALALPVSGGCASGGASATGGDTTPDADTNGPGGEDAGDGAAAPELVSQNNGGGDLAARFGGAVFSGEAAGEVFSGDLQVSFTADGVLDTLGGTLLGSFFGLPLGSEVFFDYQNETVFGTYMAGTEPRSLESFLAETAQRVELRQIVVVLIGDSFSASTTYRSNLPGQTGTDQRLDLQGTPLVQTEDRVLDGVLLLAEEPDHPVAEFALERE